MKKLIFIMMVSSLFSNTIKHTNSSEQRIQNNVAMKQSKSIHPDYTPLYTFSAQDSLYISKRKSHVFAGTLACLTNIFGLGHAYTENWVRSIPFTIGLIVGMTIVESKLRADIKGNLYFVKDTQYYFGNILLLGSFFGSIYDASKTAKEINYELYKSIYNEDMPKGFDKKLSKKLFANQKQKY